MTLFEQYDYLIDYTKKNGELSEELESLSLDFFKELQALFYVNDFFDIAKFFDSFQLELDASLETPLNFIITQNDLLLSFNPLLLQSLSLKDFINVFLIDKLLLTHHQDSSLQEHFNVIEYREEQAKENKEQYDWHRSEKSAKYGLPDDTTINNLQREYQEDFLKGEKMSVSKLDTDYFDKLDEVFPDPVLPPGIFFNLPELLKDRLSQRKHVREAKKIYDSIMKEAAFSSAGVIDALFKIGSQKKESSQTRLDSNNQCQFDENSFSLPVSFPKYRAVTVPKSDSKQAGNEAGDIASLLAFAPKKSSHRWLRILSRLLTVSETEKRRTRTRLNRRQPLRFDLSGQMYSTSLNNLIIAIDTSGSVDDDLVQKFLSEIYAMIRRFSCTFTLIQCDARIHEIRTIKNLSDIKNLVILGRGGTRYEPVFELINSDKKYKNSIVVYFTDGYGSHSIPKPKCKKLIWVLSTEKSMKPRLSVKEPYGLITTID